MQPRVLITTDLHLSEKDEDQYRFKLFPWLVSNYSGQALVVVIAGDLTDRKNYHADWFVNKVVENIRGLAKSFRVFILKGNHDYDVDPTNPFFNFLGRYSGISYITEPKLVTESFGGWKPRMMFLPHTRNPRADWSTLRMLEDPNVIFMHHTFRGAVSETGYELDGDNRMKIFRRFKCPIFSGDVHVPQKVGPITYIGCPYHIHYGDQFEPKVLLADRKFKVRDIKFPSPRKWTLDVKSVSGMKRMRDKFSAGDMAKVRLHLPRGDFDSWPMQRDQIRKYSKRVGLKLHSVVLKELEGVGDIKSGRSKSGDRVLAKPKRSRSDTFTAYCDRYNIETDATNIGRVFLEE